jgi:hypothetical protein
MMPMFSKSLFHDRFVFAGEAAFIQFNRTPNHGLPFCDR